MPRRSGPSRTLSTTSTSTRASKSPPDRAGAHGAATALAARLELPITDTVHLERALVHGSLPNEQPDAGFASNERLEFLGDTIVNLVVSDALYARYPSADEGELTGRRAAIVSTAGLARVARRLDLGSALLLGQGAERGGARRRPSVLAAAFEAVVGAVHLSLGLDATRAWVQGLLAPELSRDVSLAALKSPKNRLQETVHARALSHPRYAVLSVEGPHHRRHFVVEVAIDGVGVWRGEGANRRQAETAAAEAALSALRSPRPGP
jgi:ribonuclease-3